MEKLSVGDYVRIKNGCYYTSKIAKVTSMDYKNKWYHLDIFKSDNEMIEEKDIAKHSKYIIDLIEVGDYVNGKQVLDIWTEPFGELVGMTLIELYGEKAIPTIRNIKTILTHEQFESNAYVLEKESNKNVEDKRYI